MTSTATLLHICVRNCSFESAGGVETDITSYCVHSLPHLLVMILLCKPVRMPQFSFLLYGPPFFSNTSYKVQVFAPSLSFQCYNLVSVRVPYVFYFLTFRKRLQQHQLKGSWTCCYQITVLYINMCMLKVHFQTVITVGFSLYAIFVIGGFSP